MSVSVFVGLKVMLAALEQGLEALGIRYPSCCVRS